MFSSTEKFCRPANATMEACEREGRTVTRPSTFRGFAERGMKVHLDGPREGGREKGPGHL